MFRKILLKLHKRLGEYLRVPAFNYRSLDYHTKEKRIFCFEARLPVSASEVYWITPDRQDSIHKTLAHKIADDLLTHEAIEFSTSADLYHKIYCAKVDVVK